MSGGKKSTLKGIFTIANIMKNMLYKCRIKHFFLVKYIKCYGKNKLFMCRIKIFNWGKVHTSMKKKSK